MRRRGIEGLLIRTSCVRGAGRRMPLRIVSIDTDGTVLETDMLAGHAVRRSQGVWILEVPSHIRGPDPGTRLVPLLSPML